MSNTHLVDLAQKIPDEMLISIGELTVLFGRLEHMILLAIKRKRGIYLEEAHGLYKGYSLGARLFGKQACPNAGENCQNYNSEVGLIEYSNEVEGLKELCKHIQELTYKRNSIMHGLITTVIEETILLHNKKAYKLKKSELVDLKNELINTIAKLNKMIPIPGLQAVQSADSSLDLQYSASALASDPIVKLYDVDNNDQYGALI